MLWILVSAGGSFYSPAARPHKNKEALKRPLASYSPSRLGFGHDSALSSNDVCEPPSDGMDLKQSAQVEETAAARRVD